MTDGPAESKERKRTEDTSSATSAFHDELFDRLSALARSEKPEDQAKLKTIVRAMQIPANESEQRSSSQGKGSGSIPSDKPDTSEKRLTEPEPSLADLVYKRRAPGVPSQNTSRDPSEQMLNPNAVKEGMHSYYRSTPKWTQNTDGTKNATEAEKATRSAASDATSVRNSIDTMKISSNDATGSFIGSQKFTYDRTPWVVQPSTTALTPLIAVTALHMPRTAGAQTMLLAAGSSYIDAGNFARARSTLEQFKYGSAVVADGSLFTGATLMAMKKAPKIGAPLAAASFVGRFIIDLVPNSITQISP